MRSPVLPEPAAHRGVAGDRLPGPARSCGRPLSPAPSRIWPSRRAAGGLYPTKEEGAEACNEPESSER